MSVNLTSEQLEELRNAKDNGNHILYYNLLSTYGDPYGTLAYQVVTNDSGAGAAAIAYAQTFSGTTLDWSAINTELMIAGDFAFA